MSSALRLAVRPVLAVQPARVSGVRNMSGAMGVHKNRFVEEWSNKREVSEKSFRFTDNIVADLVLKLAVPLGAMYWLIKDEQIKQDAQAGKGMKEDRYM
eukprot:g2056.t1